MSRGECARESQCACGVIKGTRKPLSLHDAGVFEASGIVACLVASARSSSSNDGVRHAEAGP